MIPHGNISNILGSVRFSAWSLTRWGPLQTRKDTMARMRAFIAPPVVVVHRSWVSSTDHETSEKHNQCGRPSIAASRSAANQISHECSSQQVFTTNSLASGCEPPMSDHFTESYSAHKGSRPRNSSYSQIKQLSFQSTVSDPSARASINIHATPRQTKCHSAPRLA